MGNVTFEHQYLNAGFDYLERQRPDARRRPPTCRGNGYSFWATPRQPKANGSSWEALLRYDHLTPNTSTALAPPRPRHPATLFDDQKQNRTIVGVAYWFPHQGNVSTALLLDYDGQSFDNITTAPTKSVAVHGLINF